jgi:hypothetical protein
MEGGSVYQCPRGVLVVGVREVAVARVFRLGDFYLTAAEIPASEEAVYNNVVPDMSGCNRMRASIAFKEEA